MVYPKQVSNEASVGPKVAKIKWDPKLYNKGQTKKKNMQVWKWHGDQITILEP